ncbi:putative pantetheine-phosphate adenylyltransferase Ecym_5670 [Eremothecium cymbalariae DBVPG|uniref:Cytidyltransferase-like domain-containing protein n=1 Tax=Eremothecium cymbalariae (strain CBS 270.75 / DBVPG 7215 / KCTC 17166 / NRRL Y-17582) TaxID=931890 RepID=I6NEB0_ERECY|nr:hypothetical protein Ecym_5670 [Eremothecium cymbalariae DBVPG\
MTTVGIIVRNINGIDVKNVLKPVFERCLPYLSSDHAVLDIVLLDSFNSAAALDSTLLSLYHNARDVLLTKELFDVGINVLFNIPSEGYSNHKWEVLFIYDLKLKDMFKHDKLETFELEDPILDLPGPEKDRDKYEVSALGGTFDHFHDGHKILLSVATLLTSKKLIVGVTVEELLVNKKYKELLESFEDRCHSVCMFLNRLKKSLEVKIVALHDICGPTGSVPEIEALIVSRETVAGGEIINKTRNQKGMKELEIYVVNILGGDESDSWKEKLSSTEIRRHHLMKNLNRK